MVVKRKLTVLLGELAEKYILPLPVPFLGNMSSHSEFSLIDHVVFEYNSKEQGSLPTPIMKLDLDH